jgi:hypothetical protein
VLKRPARRRNWCEDVQWNIARRDEAFRLADGILGEDLAKDLETLYRAYFKSTGCPTRWRQYLRTQRQLAETHKGSLPALRKLWKALDELPPKPKHLTRLRDAGVDLRWEVTRLMRAVFAAEMGLRLRPPGGARLRPSKLAMAFDRSRQTVDGGAHYREHPFIVADPKGALRAEIWEPYGDIAHRDHGFLKALAGGLDLECVILPATIGMWHPGRTVPVVFYQRQSIYRSNIEAAIERMVKELPSSS